MDPVSDSTDTSNVNIDLDRIEQDLADEIGRAHV